MTYDDLVQELSMQKKTVTDQPTQAWGFSRIQAIFGYSFSSMDFNLPSGGNSFSMSGIDIRANGQLIDSIWQLEGGLKNYGRVSSGSSSAESRVMTVALKTQNYLNPKLQYVVGASSSIHWINARDLIKAKNEIDLSLNITGGVRGSLTQQLSWGVDVNAYSPISGNTLNGGLEAIVLLSSIL